LIQLSQPGFIFGNGQASRAISGSSQTTFVVGNGDTKIVCTLTFSSTSNVLTNAGIECNKIGDNADFFTSYTTHSWTFYDKIGDTVYKIDASATFDSSNNILDQVTLCMTASCGTSAKSTCLTYPSEETSLSSGMSFVSSDPEGFVMAFVESSCSLETPPTIQPVVATTAQPSSVSSMQSMPSSTPEGFVFAFVEPTESSEPSTASSAPEGFVFAFTGSSATTG